MAAACTGNLPRKCANCGGHHQADAEICKVYQYKLSMLEQQHQQQQQTKPRYIPAPLPKNNAWTTNQQVRASGPTGAGRASADRKQDRPIPVRESQDQRRPRSERDSEREIGADFDRNFPSLRGARSQAGGYAPKQNQQQAGKSANDLMHAMGRLKGTYNMSELCRFLNDFADLKLKYPDGNDLGLAIIQFVSNTALNYNL